MNATRNALDPLAPWAILPSLVSAIPSENGGGSGSGDEDEDDEDEDEEDEDESGSDGKAGDGASDDKTDDESGEEELPASVKTILRKNRREARAAKAELASVRAELAKLKGGTGGAPAGDAKDLEAKLEAARLEGRTEGYSALGKANARAALLSAGLQGGKTAIERALKLIDFDEVKVEADGTVEGLDDQIEELREEMPSLFKAERKRTRRINGDDGERGPVGGKKSATEIQAARLLGK